VSQQDNVDLTTDLTTHCGSRVVENRENTALTA